MHPTTIAAIAGAGVAVGLGAYAMLYEQFALRVRNLDVSFPNLPLAFDGYTLLHISDLHLTKLGLLERRTMEIISRREVDGCVVTGDVTAQPRASDIFRRICSVIPHRDPIYMVLGNSEHKPWLDTDMLVEALSFDGLHILNNSSTTLTRSGESIAVVGVDDAFSHRSDVDAAFAGVDPQSFVLFLTHSPCITPEAIDRGADLILSGHTHGGQVRIPGMGLVWTHMHRNKELNDGLYGSAAIERATGAEAGNSVLFVNRGTGTSRFHIRFLCPPEIVYITLHRASTPSASLDR